MELFDTHCHIQSAGLSRGERTTRDLWAKAGDVDPDAIIERAHAAGVAAMVCVGCDLEDSQLAIDFAQSRPNIYVSIGIHPHEAEHYIAQKGQLDAFAALADASKVVAVGECGLDYFYTHSPKEAQIEVLKFQIELALEHNLPLIFHIREALDEFWPIFDSYEGIRGVLHSFTDTTENMMKAVERGLYIGVNGIATFSKRLEQLDMYRSIPLKNLVLETDAPFLTPVPYRGSICEPYHVSTTANFLSDLRGEDLETLAAVTTSNSKQLFNM
jgi:TatD DNase family protein